MKYLFKVFVRTESIETRLKTATQISLPGDGAAHRVRQKIMEFRRAEHTDFLDDLNTFIRSSLIEEHRSFTNWDQTTLKTFEQWCTTNNC